MNTPPSKDKEQKKKKTPPSTATLKGSDTSMVCQMVTRNLTFDNNQLTEQKKSKSKKPFSKEKSPSKTSSVKKNAQSMKPSMKRGSHKQLISMAKKDSSLQAHAIKWTSKRHVKMALVRICDGYSEENAKTISYEDLLKKLILAFTPKQLDNAFPVICMEKGIDYKRIDTDMKFANKKNVQKRFIEVCMKGRTWIWNLQIKRMLRNASLKYA
jgi:hypothetical protein